MISAVKFRNMTPYPTRIVGTTINLKPDEVVDLLTYLALTDMINLYGLTDMIDSNLVEVTVFANHEATTVPDGATFRAIVLSEISNESGGGTGPGNGIVQNVVYVDPNGSDQHGDGSSAKPFKTIAKGCRFIGNAKDAGDFNNNATAEWMLLMAAGIYNENVVLPIRQVLQLGMEGVTINGNISLSVDGSKYYGGLVNEARVVFKGLDMDGAGPNVPPSLVNGDVSMAGSLGMVCHVQGLHCNFGGSILFNNLVVGGPDLMGLVCVIDCDIAGMIAATRSQVALYAANKDNLPANTIHGILGNVQLAQLKNVEFDGAVVTSSSLGGHWREVSFDALSHDFSAASGKVVCDTDSANSFNANVSNHGAVVLQLADNAAVIFYSPTRPSDWKTSPSSTRDALDELSSRVKSLEGSLLKLTPPKK